MRSFSFANFISYFAGYLVHLHFCSTGKTNFPSCGSGICVFVCLFVWSLTSQGIKLFLPSLLVLVFRKGQVFSGSKILKWHRRQSTESQLKPAFLKDQLPVQPTVLDSSPGLHLLLDYIFSLNLLQLWVSLCDKNYKDSSFLMKWWHLWVAPGLSAAIFL